MSAVGSSNSAGGFMKLKSNIKLKMKRESNEMRQSEAQTI